MNLETLSLGNNSITALPPSLGQLSKLTSLDVEANELSTLPGELAQLTRLKVLNAQTNHFGSVPAVVFSIVSLEDLRLGENEIAELPPAIGMSAVRAPKKGRPRVLTMRRGALLAQLQNLRNLAIDGNRLQDLPTSLARCRYLAHLNIEGNPLSHMKKATVSGGAASIMAYLRKNDKPPKK